MNQEEVVTRVKEIYDISKDKVVKDYLDDLDSFFEPEAYQDITDLGIVEDVETYREVNKEYYLNPTPIMNPKYAASNWMEVGTAILEFYTSGNLNGFEEPIYKIFGYLLVDVEGYCTGPGEIIMGVAQDYWRKTRGEVLDI